MAERGEFSELFKGGALGEFRRGGEIYVGKMVVGEFESLGTV